MDLGEGPGLGGQLSTFEKQNTEKKLKKVVNINNNMAEINCNFRLVALWLVFLVKHFSTRFLNSQIGTFSKHDSP